MRICPFTLPGGLCEDGLVARPAPAADRPAATVEETHLHPVPVEHAHQRDLGLVEFPVGGEVAPVLVAVGVAEHHFLHAAAARDDALPRRQREQLVHDDAAAAQVGDDFEKRHDVDVGHRLGARAQQPDLLQQDRDLQHVAHAIGLGDHVVGKRSGTEAAVYRYGGVEDREFARRAFLVGDEWRAQGACEFDLGEQPVAPLGLGQRRISFAAGTALDEFRDRLLVHPRVLAHVERLEMEPEHLDRTDQAAHATARDAGSSVRFQGRAHDVQVGKQCVRTGIGRRRCRRIVRRSPRREGSRREASEHPSERAAVGLVDAVLRAVGRGIRQCEQFVAHPHESPRHAQFGRKLANLGKIVLQGECAVALEGVEHGVAIDARVAAVAADPAAYAQQRRQAYLGASRGREQVLDVRVQLRHFLQEGVAIVREPVLDLVEHGEPHRAQDARLPQRRDDASQRLVRLLAFAAGGRVPVPFGEEPSDLALTIEDAATLHLGRVGGEYGADQHRAQGGLDLLAADAGCGDPLQHCAQRACCSSGGLLEAVEVAVLGDVRELGEEAEGPHDCRCLDVVELRKQLGEFGGRGFVASAAEADRGLTDAFDALECGVALLLAQRVAEQAAQVPDVVAQASLGVVHRIGALRPCDGTVRGHARIDSTHGSLPATGHPRVPAAQLLQKPEPCPPTTTSSSRPAKAPLPCGRPATWKPSSSACIPTVRSAYSP